MRGSSSNSGAEAKHTEVGCLAGATPITTAVQQRSSKWESGAAAAAQQRRGGAEALQLQRNGGAEGG